MTVLFKRLILLTLLFALIVFVGLRLGLPHLADKALQDYFSRHKTTYSADTFDFNILSGTLDLSGVSLQSSGQQTPFTIEHIVAEIELMPLIHRHWQINALVVDTPHIQLTPSDEGWALGNIPLEKHLSGVFSDDADADDHQSWTTHVAYARLSNGEITLLDPSKSHWQIQLLEVNEWQVKKDHWTLGLSTEGRLNGATFKVQTHFQGNDTRYTHWFGIEHLQGSFSDVAAWLPQSLHNSQADFELSGEYLISQTANETNLSSTRSQFALRNANLNLPNAAIQAVQAEGLITQLALSRTNEQFDRLELKGTFSGKDTLIWSADRAHILAGSGQWKAKEFALLKDQHLTFLTPQLSLEQVLLGDSPDVDPPLPPILTLQSLTFNNLHQQSARLHADQLTLEQPHLTLEYNRQGHLLNGLPTQRWTSMLRTAGLNADALSVYQVSQEKAGQIDVILNQSNDTESEQKNTLFSGTLSQLEMEGLDSGAPGQALHTLFTLQGEQTDQLTVDARLWPFAPQLGLDIRADLTGYHAQTLKALLTSPLTYAAVPQANRHGIQSKSPANATLQLTIYQNAISGEWQPYRVDETGTRHSARISLLQGTLSESMPASAIIQTLTTLVSGRL